MAVSAFAQLLDELTRECMVRFQAPLPRHWREDPGQPEDSTTRWSAWLEGPGGFVAFGRAGEEALRNLLAMVKREAK